MPLIFTPRREENAETRDPYYQRLRELFTHYGVAFLLIKRGDVQQAAEHLRAFLARPPKGPDAERWIRHAESALRDIASSPARETL